MPVLLIILAHFVEVVLVELAYKAGEIAMFEMLGKDGFRKFLALQPFHGDVEVSLQVPDRVDNRIASYPHYL